MRPVGVLAAVVLVCAAAMSGHWLVSEPRIDKQSKCTVPAIPEARASMRSGEASVFGIYLLKDKSIAAERALEMGPEKVEVEPRPLFSIDDITGYNWADHTFALTEEARERLPIPGVFGIPFVVAVNAKPVYVGAFWTPVSSVSFPGPVIDVFTPRILREASRCTIESAYPGSGVGERPDPRGNPEIRKAFEEAGKLVDTRSLQ